MKKIVVSEFAPGRGGAFAQWLPDAQIIRRHRGEALPESFDMLIMGGGPMGPHAQDRLEHPFLQVEYQLINQVWCAGKTAPSLVGICLGAQLIIEALGGQVIPGPVVRGWNTIKPRRLHAMYPSDARIVQFEFHGNHIVKLPRDATVLAASREDTVEAFAIGDRILGTTYHPEVTHTDALHIYTQAGLTAEEHHHQVFDDPGMDAVVASTAFFDLLRSLLA